VRHVVATGSAVASIAASALPLSLPASGMAGGGPPAAGIRETQAIYPPGARPTLPRLAPLGQVFDTYIVAEGPDGLYIVDQHAAHERVLYERLLAAHRRGGVSEQLLAMPVPVELTPADAARVTAHRDHLASLGFDLEAFGARTVLIRAIPAQAAGAAPDALVQRAVAALGEEGDHDDAVERLAIATACHTAIRAGDRLGPDAITALLADLAATEDPFTCFHGRPTMVAAGRHELERWFLRG
jgi:DNA mismatch repair protein MutL